MARKPARVCRFPGCPNTTTDRSGYCPSCKSRMSKKYENSRETAVVRGYDVRWSKIRAVKLAQDPVCESCWAEGIATPATLVHHRDRDPRNNDMSNLRSMCVLCHEEEHKSERFRKPEER